MGSYTGTDCLSIGQALSPSRAQSAHYKYDVVLAALMLQNSFCWYIVNMQHGTNPVVCKTSITIARKQSVQMQCSLLASLVCNLPVLS